MSLYIGVNIIDLVRAKFEKIRATIQAEFRSTSTNESLNSYECRRGQTPFRFYSTWPSLARCLTRPYHCSARLNLLYRYTAISSIIVGYCPSSRHFPGSTFSLYFFQIPHLFIYLFIMFLVRLLSLTEMGWADLAHFSSTTSPSSRLNNHVPHYDLVL